LLIFGQLRKLDKEIIELILNKTMRITILLEKNFVYARRKIATGKSRFLATKSKQEQG